MNHKEYIELLNNMESKMKDESNRNTQRLLESKVKILTETVDILQKLVEDLCDMVIKRGKKK